MRVRVVDDLHLPAAVVDLVRGEEEFASVHAVAIGALLRIGDAVVLQHLASSAGEQAAAFVGVFFESVGDHCVSEVGGYLHR